MCLFQIVYMCDEHNQILQMYVPTSKYFVLADVPNC